MAKKSTAIDVTQGVIWQQLLSLCVPIFFSSFFQQAYTLIGTYIVGQFGGKLALGGIQATMVLTELCIGFCVGVGAGCAVITGQYFGQHDDERLSRSVHTAMTLALVGGIVFSILGIVFVEPMLVLMNTPHELLAEGVAYARCYFAAMVAALLLNMGTALLRAVGDTRGPAVIIASGCLVNAVLDVIFVAVLHMEALGCGIAVALTICSNATMIVIRMMHAPGAWRLSLSKLGIDPGICKSMIVWSAAWLSVCCVFDFQRFDSGVGQLVWCRCHHGVGSFGPLRWHCLDGYRGARRVDHHVLGTELWRAQL